MTKRVFAMVLMSAIFAALAAAGPAAAPAGEAGDGSSVLVDKWLLAGPVSAPLPLRIGGESSFSARDYLGRDVLDPRRLWIEEGEAIAWSGAERLVWRAQVSPSGELRLSAKGERPQLAFLVSYLDASRWQQSRIRIESSQALKVWLDGEPLLELAPAPGAGPKAAAAGEADIVLSQGKHCLAVSAVRDPGGAADWTIKATLAPVMKGTVTSGSSPVRKLTEDDVVNARRVSGVSMSPDGTAVLYTVSQRNPRTQRGESWIEVCKVPGGEIERVIREPRGLGGVAWSPDGRALCGLVPVGGGASDLWLIDRRTGEVDVLLRAVEGLESFTWSPTGEYVVYTVAEERVRRNPNIQVVRSIDDRYPFFTNEVTYYLLTVASKASRRLITGFPSSSPGGETLCISPDGARFELAHDWIDPARPPYHAQDLWVHDLAKGTSEMIFSTAIRDYDVGDLGAEWSPDGKSLYFVGPQSVRDVGGHNEHDQDIYRLDPATRALACVTEDFTPSVNRIRICAKGGTIFLSCQDKSRVQLYRTGLEGGSFRKVETGIDYVGGFDVSDDGRTIVFVGESATTPARLFVMDADGGRPRPLYDPDGERWKNVLFGKVEDFAFRNRRGDEIDGFLYYPADFDPARKYPMVVYYYGGVSATNRNFNTSLLNYAANGYMVYVLNPSGAIGYGPRFSDLGVNDWGKIVTEEIIDGVTKVVKAKPFIDGRRIGAYGHSHGGGMTNCLAVKTDIFRALIASAGISDLATQWGVGTWGYSYMGVVLAGSFPWNRRDFYVDRSPLYHADKVKTPMLFLHGAVDTNVPRAEADEFYTALKFLGKDVEYIRFMGEDHSIQGSDENRRLVPRIRLAWWDKNLKGEPEAWENVRKN